MTNASKGVEKQGFSRRLRVALEGAGVSASPTVVANHFNLRYQGRGITSHTARAWLMGVSIPTQDKLKVLAQWLQVSPEELRFGLTGDLCRDPGTDEEGDGLSMQDREMLRYFQSLPREDRVVVCRVVLAMAQAVTRQA